MPTNWINAAFNQGSLGGILGLNPNTIFNNNPANGGSRQTANNAEINTLQSLTGLAGSQANISLPALQQASAYYSALLGTAPPSSTGQSNPLGLTYLNAPVVPQQNNPGSGSGGLVNVLFPFTNLFGIGGHVGKGGPPGLAEHDSQIANSMTGDAKKILDAVNAGTLTPQDAYNNLQGLWSWATNNFQQSSWTNSQKQYMDQWMKSMTDLGAKPGAPGSTANTSASGAGGGFGSSQSRAVTQSLLSGPIQQTTQQYNTARQNILNSMPPGGARDRALADLEASRSGTISNFFNQAPQIGAAGLTNIGLGSQSGANQSLSTLLSGANNIFNQQLAQSAQSAQTGVGIGSLLGSVLFGQGGGSQGLLALLGLGAGV